MRPPKEFEDKPWHWVKTGLFPHGEPLGWVNGAWIRPGDEREYSIRAAQLYGWVWLGVAEPPENGWETRG